jgi:hypothetical protein
LDDLTLVITFDSDFIGQDLVQAIQSIYESLAVIRRQDIVYRLRSHQPSA